MEISKNFPQKKDPISVAVRADQELFTKLEKPFIKAIQNSLDKKLYSEAFLLSWGFVEQILLPSLIRLVAHRLKLTKLPKIDENTHFAQLLNYYYFLTHDVDLYEKLSKANSMRNKIVHRLDEEKLRNLNSETKAAANYTLIQVSLSIASRLRGDVTVPVLELYSKGWNDFRKKLLDHLEDLEKKYKIEGHFRKKSG